DRRPVGHSRAALADASRPARPMRSAVARAAPRVGRRRVAPSHRGALERPAGSLSVLSGLPSRLSALGTRRHTPARAQGSGRRSPCPWRVGSERNLHRRHLCQRQTKGLHVGKTKRGKGTKIMAIADGAGLPLAITIASASPHETQLVAQTLNASFLGENPERLIGDAAYDSD